MEAWKNNDKYQEYYKTLLENNIPEKIIDKTFLELSHKNYFYTLDLKQQLFQLQQEKEELIKWLEEKNNITDGYDLDSDYFSVRDFKIYNNKILSIIGE